MLSHLTLGEITAIAEAASASAQDDRAMKQYLHPEAARDELWIFTAAELAADAAAGAYDSPERRHLNELVGNLSAGARQELIALMFLGRGDTADFAVALRHAKRASDGGDHRYVAAKPLHVYLPAALSKLGLKPG